MEDAWMEGRRTESLSETGVQRQLGGQEGEWVDGRKINKKWNKG